MSMLTPRSGLVAFMLVAGCSGGDTGALTEDGGTISAEALAEYTAGTEFFDRRIGRADADSAVARFGRAVELAPDHAASWAGLSQARMWLEFNQGVAGQLPLAQQAAARAETLAPDAAETHMAKGYVAYWGLADLDTALQEFLAAEEVDSEDATVAGAIGNVYRRQGELREAIQYYERRVELDPSHTQGLVTLAGTYNGVGRYADVARVATELRALGDSRGPVWDFWAHFNGGDTASAFAIVPEIRAEAGEPGYFDLLPAIIRRDDDAATALADSIGYDVGGGLRFEESYLLYHTGQVEEHADAFESWIGNLTASLDADAGSAARALHLESSRRRNLALLEALRGNEAEARSHAERVLELQPQLHDVWGSSGHRYGVALTYVLLGDNDTALGILESLSEQGFGTSSGWLQHHPSLDPLRGEPRFYDVIQAERAVEKLR